MKATVEPRMSDFVEVHCLIGLQRTARWTALYVAWCTYCLHNGTPYAGTFEAFEIALHRATGVLHVIVDQDGPGFYYVGIGLRSCG